MTSLVLYTYKWSMAAYRVRAALNLKGVAVEEVEVDLDRGEQFEPHIRQNNPECVTPALSVPGAPLLTQSMAILEYIEERYPDPPLLPRDDLAGRARVRSLAGLIAADVHPLLTHRVQRRLAEQFGEGDEATLGWSRFWLDRGLEAFEARLSDDGQTGRFCHGGTVTLADICLASLVVVAEARGYSSARYPTVTRIVNACRELDAFPPAPAG